MFMNNYERFFCILNPEYVTEVSYKIKQNNII